MTISAEIVQRWSRQAPYLEETKKRVKDIVLAYVEPRGYAFAGRCKTLDSIAEKIETGRYSAWSELDDLYACTIVVPTLEDEPPVVEYLGNVFDIVNVKRRGDSTKDPLVFRFDSTRVTARLGRASGVSEPSEVPSVMFEVQIRTAFEHAWSATTHKLAYKGARIDWRRLRLAAQLKAAVEQLDLLIAGYDSVADLIHPQQWPEIAVKQKIEALFRSAFDERKIPSELQPNSWTRFCDNVFELLRRPPNGRLRRFSNDGEKRDADRLLELVAKHIEADRARFPMSISLYQYVLGVLSNEGQLAKNSERYFPLVTQSLLALYPAADKIESRFRIDETP